MSLWSRKYPLWLVFLSFVSISLFIPSPANSQREDPRYRNRGCYNEGTQDEDVSGPALVLISALAGGENQEIGVQQGASLPEVFKLNFHRESSLSVFIIVREKKKKRNYWLDNVSCIQQANGRNHFEWSTEKVIRQIGLSMNALGVFVGLDGAKPGDPELRVAPAIFYDNRSGLPVRITNYEFTFRSRIYAQFDYEVCRQGAPCRELLKDGSVAWVNSGSPISAQWDASRAPEGHYVLYAAIAGDTKRKQIVRFYHRPIVD